MPPVPEELGLGAEDRAHETFAVEAIDLDAEKGARLRRQCAAFAVRDTIIPPGDKSFLS